MRVSVKEIIVSFRITQSVGKTASDLGISRITVYRWLRRCRNLHLNGYRWAGIKRRSTRPKTIHYKITSQTSQVIISLRESMHLGSRKIKFMLGTSFSERTIHRFLKRKGKIAKQTNYRRPKFQNVPERLCPQKDLL